MQISEIAKTIGRIAARTACSCSDLARYSGLTFPTVARPPSLSGFNERYGLVSGIDLTATAMRVGIAELRGKLLGEAEATTFRAVRLAKTPDKWGRFRLSCAIGPQP